MTASYMGRAYLLTFEGEYRGHAHPHESPATMTIPLCVLAVFSVIAGFFSLPMGFLGREHAGAIDHMLVGEGGPSWFPGVPEDHFNLGVAAGGTVAALVGFWVAWNFYGSRKWSIESFTATIGPIHRWVVNKFYFDDAYLWLVREVQQRVADLCGAFEKNVLVQGVVGGLCEFTKWLGRLVRLVLDGHLHRYVTVALFGVVLVLAYLGMRN
jgi:NADH-quinone oxidoreductase subunit L